MFHLFMNFGPQYDEYMQYSQTCSESSVDTIAWRPPDIRVFVARFLIKVEKDPVLTNYTLVGVLGPLQWTVAHLMTYLMTSANM